MLKKIFCFVAMLAMLFSFAGCNELAVYKTAAKTTIETYAREKGDAAYTAEDWAVVAGFLVTAGKTAVDASESKSDVDSAVEAAKESIDAARNNEWTLLKSECYEPIEPSDVYYSNISKSMAAHMEAMLHFGKVPNQPITNYTDDYGGSYIDCNGIYNICVLGDRVPVVSDYLIYKQVQNPYNFLHSVQDEVHGEASEEIMQQYSVWGALVCASCNRATIYLENGNKIPLFIEYLKAKNLYKKGSLYFYVQDEAFAEEV